MAVGIAEILGLRPSLASKHEVRALGLALINFVSDQRINPSIGFVPQCCSSA